ncbi:hypothetical protein KKC1_24880 [Calderihabitans maritimus]|uniref:Uncharacterized protein n=1 Tax=Calderihabitans maritimus TaxID=1246530 RepID=A0A1Z5HVK3_9FIRM|nr:hypothetical protein KKC1_24880 [Calderihabitans maritimus]
MRLYLPRSGSFLMFPENVTKKGIVPRKKNVIIEEIIEL